MENDKTKPFTVGINGEYENQYDSPGNPNIDNFIQTQVPYPQPNYQQQAPYYPQLDSYYSFNKDTHDLQIEYQKKCIQAEKEIYVAQKKIQLRDAERQQKKAEYDQVYINPDNNRLCIQTINTCVKSPPMYISNFVFSEFIIFQRIENHNDKIYYLKCQIDQEEKYLYLLENKCHRPAYILKGLSSIGGQIMANSESRRKDYVAQWLNFLKNTHNNVLWVPDRKGWYKDPDGKINFWKEWYTWEGLFKQTI